MNRSHLHAAAPALSHVDELSGTVVLRDLIDEALHFVITRNYPKSNQGLGKCPVYASLGAKVLSSIFGRPFVAVAGGQITDFGGGMYVVACHTRSERRNARSLEDLSKYHCWIQSEIFVPGHRHRVEIVDFTVRHDRLMAEELGYPYLIQNQRDYLWCWHDELVMPSELMNHPDLGGHKERFWIWKDERCTLLLKENEKKHQAHYDEMAGEVFQRLGRRIEEVFPANLFPATSEKGHSSGIGIQSGVSG